MDGNALPSIRLQLSHVHSNVETSLFEPFIIATMNASIEPRSFKRGNLLESVGYRIGELASIEPRSFKRGNEAEAVWKVLCKEALQLSHVHSNVETRRCDEIQAACRALQLSHVHSNVETEVIGLFMKVRRPASIEPRSFKRGNAQRWQKTWDMYTGFN